MTLVKRAQLWGLTTVILLLASIDVLRTGKRLSHTTGVVGRGTIRMVDNPTFPAHDFFRPGRTFSCRIRHSSATYNDEAMLQVRGVALKFADSDYESPLDLEMNTGEMPAFWTLHMFWRWTAIRVKIIRSTGPSDWTPLLRYFEEHPTALKAAREGVRRNPSSFARLFFYTEFPIHFRARDGRQRYAKLRLIPSDRGPESGLPDQSELKEIWKNEARLPGDTQPPNFLSQEWAERVAREGVSYLLQLQLHEWQPGDTEEVFNSSRPWSQEASPWHDLATVDIREVIPAEKASRLRYSIGHQPPSLGLIAATSVHDYNSMNYARARMAFAKHVRILASRLRGQGPAAPAPISRPISAGPEVPTAS